MCLGLRLMSGARERLGREQDRPWRSQYRSARIPAAVLPAMGYFTDLSQHDWRHQVLRRCPSKRRVEFFILVAKSTRSHEIADEPWYAEIIAGDPMRSNEIQTLSYVLQRRWEGGG
jgi:hypothetical protein